MKKYLALGMMVLMLCTIGMTCKNVTQKQIAYKTLAAIGLSVSTATDAYAVAMYNGKVKQEDWNRVVSIHNDYLIAYNQACRLAAYDFSKYASDDLLRMEVELLTAINQVLSN